MTIRKARVEELDTIMSIIDDGRQIMRDSGNMNQWTDGYPSRELILEDIYKGIGYVVVDEGMTLLAYFAFIPGPDVTYQVIYEGAWLDADSPYYVIHRMAKRSDAKGIIATVLDYCATVANNIKVDTHRDNVIMNHNLRKHGFTYCGIIYLLNGDERLAYQRIQKVK